MICKIDPPQAKPNEEHQTTLTLLGWDFDIILVAPPRLFVLSIDMPLTLDSLPIDDVLPELIEKLSSSQAVVLTASPGAGKTTRVPPAILKAGLLGDGMLVMLEPRRLAARAGATMMAQLAGEPVGQTVGYKVRFDERASAATKLLVVTEGILSRRLIDDPFLEGVTCVVIDEFHERSQHVDLALAFLKELLSARDDLKLVVMSATLDAKAVSEYLGGAPVVSSEGRLHPVEITHLPREDERPLALQIAGALSALIKNSDDDGGDVLVFLPGAPEITRVYDYIGEKGLFPGVDVLRLYGALSLDEQDRVLSKGVRRRFILSTNIAETSLTVPGVSSVVDSGLAKVISYDYSTGLERLVLSKTSHASATQRAGRAGRLRPGRVARLWTEYDHRGRRPFDDPEIRRVDIASALLQVLAFHPGNPTEFDFFEAPPKALLDSTLGTLRLLRAVEQEGFGLTEKGNRLLGFPVHPRIGAILLRALESKEPEAGVLLAAVLSEDQERPDKTEKGDVLWRLEQFGEVVRTKDWRGAARRNGLSMAGCERVRRTHRQLMRLARAKDSANLKAWATSDEGQRELRRITVAGFADRLCRLRPDKRGHGTMVTGRGVRLFDPQLVQGSEFFVAIDVDAGKKGERSSSFVRRVLELSLNDILAECGDACYSRQRAVFDAAKETVYGQEQTILGQILAEKPSGDVPMDQISGTLVREATSRFLSVFKPDKDASSLIDRIRFAANNLPEQEWPDVSGEGLAGLLKEQCYDKRSFEQLRKIDWVSVLKALLGYDRLQRLERQVPTRYELPTGFKAPIDYSQISGPNESPILAAKIQDMFGVLETPRIAGGRIRLKVHLLAPNRRPAQVTDDLKSFWEGTYRDVRKDLRARYPKHPWPENPLDMQEIEELLQRRPKR